MRYRLIKPNWGVSAFPDGKPNKDLVREVEGYNVYEGDNFNQDFLSEMNHKGYNLYYFPNGTTKTLEFKEKLSGRQVDKFEWVFVDMDLKDGVYKSKEDFVQIIKNFPLVPSWGLDSGNGIHIYWKISEVDRVQFMEIQLRLIQLFNTDQSIYTPLQLMRVPGSLNTKKPDNFVQTQMLGDFPLTGEMKSYSFADFDKHLPAITSENRMKIKEHNDMLNGVTDVKIGEDIGDLPEKFEKLMEKNSYISRLFHEPEATKGDRSSADMALANLLFSLDFDREEAIHVIYNSKKARTRNGDQRYRYAVDTVTNAYSTNSSSMAAPNLSFYKDNPDSLGALGEAVKGPHFLDTQALAGGWRKGQMLGLIGGTGTGKTTFTLKIFKEFITNNPNNNDIFFLVGIEMNAREYYDSWRVLVGNNEEHYSRLYIIEENFFEKNDLSPTIQNIYKIIRDTSRTVGRKVGAVCIDHLHILPTDFDSSVQPLFGADISQHVDSVRGTKIRLSLDGICETLKRFCRRLNCFLIIQSQTTKDKDDGGDIPIGKNACFGTSKFEWYCDYVIGMWMPLKRVEKSCKEANLFVTAFQYNKIRHHDAKKDNVAIGTHYLLKFIPEQRDYLGLTAEEMDAFYLLQEDAIKKREAEKNKRSKSYYRAPVSLEKSKVSVEEGEQDEEVDES